MKRRKYVLEQALSKLAGPIEHSDLTKLEGQTKPSIPDIKKLLEREVNGCEKLLKKLTELLR